jgi:hypothetical protein
MVMLSTRWSTCSSSRVLTPCQHPLPSIPFCSIQQYEYVLHVSPWTPQSDNEHLSFLLHMSHSIGPCAVSLHAVQPLEAEHPQVHINDGAWW